MTPCLPIGPRKYCADHIVRGPQVRSRTGDVSLGQAKQNNKETTIKPKNKDIKETTRAPLVSVDSRLFLPVRFDCSMGNKLTMCCQPPRYVHVS
jgi:hypothetical protein